MSTKVEEHCPTHGVIYEPRCHYCREYASRASRRQGYGWRADEIAAMIADNDALRAENERKDHALGVEAGWRIQLQDEIERLRAMLSVVASCSENDDVAFGQHLCVEQVRVEVGRHNCQYGW